MQESIQHFDIIIPHNSMTHIGPKLWNNEITNETTVIEKSNLNWQFFKQNCENKCSPLNLTSVIKQGVTHN